MSADPCRLIIAASHPIQYFTPIYRWLAAQPGIDVQVLFYRDFGVAQRFDKQFGRSIRWDVDQLSGYSSQFLWNASPIGDPFNPLHAVNPGVMLKVARRADAVWLNGYTYPSNWLALFGAALRRTPVLFRSELRLTRDEQSHALDAIRDRIIRWWIKRSDALLHIGDENRRAYLAYGARREQLFFTPYSVDTEAMTVARAERDRTGGLRESWGLQRDKLVVLSVGKLTQRKHPEAVLDLAADASLSRRIHVVFAGSGPLEAQLRARVDAESLTNVTFLGFVNQATLPHVYASADLFVLPSEREPWGLVLNEAMAARLAPVVSDAVGAAADLIRDGDTGLLFPSGDWGAMRQAVARLVADDSFRQRVASRAAELVQGYGHESAGRGVLEALRYLGCLPGDPSDASPRALAGAR